MSDWTRVKEYGALFEAELAQQQLEQAGIPVLLKGPITGAFGPGFSGPTAQGVTLMVPGGDHERALDILEDNEDVES